MNKRIEERLVLRKEIKLLFSKLLISIIVFLIGMILVKDNPNMKNILKENIYENSFKFVKTKKLYEKYFGKYLSLEKEVKEEAVFSEKLNYLKEDNYQDGVNLSVSNNYMVPILESGIVVFIGEKENLGNTVIIEQIDGIDTYYGNIEPNNLKLYDYVEKGELLGEVKSNKLYLAFQKDGKFLDYKKYI